METIYFVHGNGFPGMSYRKLFTRLKEYDYDVYALDKIGHKNSYPITQNWPFLVDELIEQIQTLAYPVIAVGHSMGGVLNLMASVRRPDLFKAVITLDSFFISKLKLKMLHIAKYLGLIDYCTPGKRTKNRRVFWENEREMRQYFQSRAFFQQLDPECLEDYIQYGVQRTKTGCSLTFDREREYQIYATLPHDFSVFQQRNSALKVPGALIYGKQSEILSSADIRSAEKLYHLRCFPIVGSHMFPLEHPIETADKIHQVIEILLMSN